LLDFNALVLFNMDTTDNDVLLGGIERLMPSTIFIIYVLANDFPIFDIEDVFIQNAVCIFQSV